ncbi:MAG: pyridoxamine 5'-phosphate oxidase [Alphaproteobacteria bacterium]
MSEVDNRERTGKAKAAGELDGSRPPLELFAAWYKEAHEKEPGDPEAMALATATPDGLLSARMVLLKGFDERGFVFYTNLESRKGRDLAANARAALLFYWKSLRRQVRIEGPVVEVSEEEADAYFDTRPRQARIGAWASPQSRPLAGRFELEKRVAKYAAKYALGRVPRPPFWSGFRVVPERIEFWRHGAFRLHDRLVYTRTDRGGWRTERLYP